MARVRWRTAVLAALGLYAVVMVGSPLLHHDPACHLKSPTHCSACVASPLASRAEAAARLDARRLPLAGEVECVSQPWRANAVVATSPGRAPPA